MRLYEGTPSNNVSGLEFSEAILIWRGDEYDWHKAIGDIQVNPNAVRFPRPLDRIPLRQEQLYCPIEHLEYILELERKQLIRWTFTPFQEIAPVEPISEDEQELTRIMNGSAGKNTLKLLPQIISYCRETMRWPLPYLAEPFDRSCYKFGGARISIGRPEVYVEDLDDISISRIIIVPHQSARGPNGVWMIERSERHPLILSVEGIKVFCLVDEEGKPIVSCRVGEFDHFNTPSWTQAKEMDIFTSRKSATNWARQFSKDFEEDIKVKVLESRELLTCLSHLDAVYIDDVEYAITSYGCIDAASAGISTAQEILGALTKVK